MHVGIFGGKAAFVRREKKGFAIERWGTDVKQLDNVEIVTGLSAKDILIRHLTLELTSKRDIRKALPFQLESLLPYSEEERILHTTFYIGKKETDVMVIASSKEIFNSHLVALDFEPDIVSCTPVALFRFARHFFPNIPSLFVWNDPEFIVIEEGRLKSSHIVREGEVKRIDAYLKKKHPEIGHLLLLKGKNPFPDWNVLEVDNLQHAKYATEIGLALDGAIADRYSCQLRPKERESKKHRAKQRKTLLSYLALCGCFSLCVTLLGHFQLMGRENALLDALEVPKGITLENYCGQLEKKLQGQRKAPFPLFSAPKVSETLTWLSTHPVFAKDGSITRLVYSLEKAPAIGSKVRTSSLKVDLEIKMEDPAHARSVQQTLLKDRSFIDQRKGVRWRADHGMYKASFYLKERRYG